MNFDTCIKGRVHFKTFFADSDAKYVVVTQIFFPDAQSSKTTKLLAFKVFPDSAQTCPDFAQADLGAEDVT